jgi:hypothetical protein
METSPLTDGRIELDGELYPEDCLASALQAYDEFLEAKIEVGSATTFLGLTVRETVEDKTAVRREFLNFLLDLALQRHLKA